MLAINAYSIKDCHISARGRERVAAFLLEMDRPLMAAQILALPMCRRDIADYLGLTFETVSRALSNLQGQGILGFIGTNQRQIVLVDI